MKKFLIAASVAYIASVSAVAASTVYATSVTAYHADGARSECVLNGEGFKVDDSRSNICNALGAPDHSGGQSEGGFLSAGSYEMLSFGFGQQVTTPINFFEITFNRSKGWTESLNLAFILHGEDSVAIGTAALVGTDDFPGQTNPLVNNGTDSVGDSGNPDRWIVTFDGAVGNFDRLWIMDTSGAGFGTGFDIDAIRATTVTPVPLPAAGLLLLAGLGGLGMMRRRKSV